MNDDDELVSTIHMTNEEKTTKTEKDSVLDAPGALCHGLDLLHSWTEEGHAHSLYVDWETRRVVIQASLVPAHGYDPAFDLEFREANAGWSGLPKAEPRKE